MSSSGKQKLRHSDIRRERKELLLSMEQAHKADIHTYTSGHLGPRSLTLRPLRFHSEQPLWETSKYQSKDSGYRTRRQERRMTKEMVEGVTDDIDKLIMANSAPQSEIHNSTSSSGGLCSSSLQPHKLLGILDTTDHFLGKPSCIEQQESAKEGPGCSLFTQSHLVGVTFEDQLKLRQQFGSLKTRGAASARMCPSGRDAAERHECKLKQELKKLPEGKGPHLERLAVVSKVFDDVCEGSSAFGSILREIKTEYDVYVKSIISSQGLLQDQYQYTSIEDSVVSLELEAAAEQVSSLEDEARRALEENDRIRTEYENIKDKARGSQSEEAWRSKSIDPDPADKEEDTFLDLKTAKSEMSSAAQVEAHRRQIWKLLQEVESLQKEIRDTMVSTDTVSTLEECIADTKAEMTRLVASNEHLRSANKELEQNLLMTLNRVPASEETKALVWEMILKNIDQR